MPGVYISYPFCNQKCSFCNFASGVYSFETQVRYGDALLNEIRSHSWDWLPETVYFGGGTPSLMPLELLRDLMNAIPGKQLMEITLECAPGSITSEAAAAWRNAGVNRVSLGVQSFVLAELRKTGTPAQRRNSSARCRSVAPIRHSKHQHRSDRRIAQPDNAIVGRISRLDRAPQPAARLRLHL